MAAFEIEQMLRTALGHHQAGRFAQAEGLYQQILTQSPNHDGAFHWLGVLALQHNRPDIAVEYLRRAAVLQPSIPEYHGNLANALMGLGKLDDAVACLRRLLELKPDLAEAHNTFGNALMGQGKTDEAIAAYRRALGLKPNYAPAHNNLGNALKDQGKLDEAIACYRRSLALKPGQAEAHNNLGNVLSSQRKFEDAAVCFHHVVQLKPGDAASHYNLGTAHFDQGQLNEAAACFRRALELRPEYAEALGSLGDALIGLGRLDEAAAHYRQALRQQPNRAELLNNLALVLNAQGNLDEAIATYRRALELKPDFAEAHNNLGLVLKEKGLLDDAMACYRRAIELKPDGGEAHNNLGNALREQGHLAEAVASFRRALELKPDRGETHRNLGQALRDQGKLDDAEASFHEAVRLQPDDDDAYLSRAMLWLLRGDFERGWPEYEWRWRSKRPELRQRAFAQPQWDGSPLEGRTILLTSEQGLGDTLQFVRYAGVVAGLGGNVIVMCQPPLKRLLRHSLAPIPVINYGESPPPFDVHCPLMSLPTVCRTTLETIPRNVPYVRADAESVAAWRDKLADETNALKVGLAWAGNKAQLNDRNRSMPLRDLTPLGDVPGIRFYSLQKGQPARQTHPAGLDLIDWTGDLHDFADTAALVANLDLVISVDTSVAHLAGAMGKPVWTLLSFAADWRYLLDRDDSPWYPTMRLFRQPALGDWARVAERVVFELASLRAI